MMRNVPEGIIGHTFEGYEVEVFIEHNGVTGIFVAKKDNVYRILKVAIAEEGRALILHEESFLKQIRHPGVIRLIKCIDVLGLPALVLPRYARGTLSHNLDTCSVAEIEIIFHHLLNTLQFFAEKNILHRDIKPENILIDDKGKPIFIDFGIATTAGEGLEGYTGTVDYSAPEVLLDPRLCSPQSDAYSVGVCIYYVLFKKYPSVQASEEWVDIRIEECGLSQVAKESLQCILQPNPKLRSAVVSTPKEEMISYVEPPKEELHRSNYVYVLMVLLLGTIFFLIIN